MNYPNNGTTNYGYPSYQGMMISNYPYQTNHQQQYQYFPNPNIFYQSQQIMIPSQQQLIYSELGYYFQNEDGDVFIYLEGLDRNYTLIPAKSLEQYWNFQVQRPKQYHSTSQKDQKCERSDDSKIGIHDQPKHIGSLQTSNTTLQPSQQRSQMSRLIQSQSPYYQDQLKNVPQNDSYNQQNILSSRKTSRVDTDQDQSSGDESIISNIGQFL